MESPEHLQSIYQTRFEAKEAYRQSVWRVLIDHWFSRWVRPDHVVLDVGCGYGEFINQVTAAKKFGMDLNPATGRRLSPDVLFMEQDCSRPWNVPPDSLDIVFTSNFFEHLPDKACLSGRLEQACRALKPGGGPHCNGAEHCSGAWSILAFLGSLPAPH